MPVAMQIKLLVLKRADAGALSSNTLIPIDCRVVAATKVDLLDLCNKAFRDRPVLPPEHRHGGSAAAA